MKSSQIKIEEPSPSTPAITTPQSSQSHQIIMESISTFRSVIPRIRDILRSIAITGMDSMRHICIYLLSRYMTHDKVAMFGLPEELCWENFMDMIRRQNGGKIKALDLFYHPEVEDCLLNHFDNLFDTKKFSFDLKHTKDNKEVNKHAEILEILDKVDMTNIECQMDILGWVYEQHLGTGAKSGRDLGQFFTDRFICEYMTHLCRPAFKSDRVPESVCDPSMGTGGFLAMYIKYYKKHYPDQPVDWSVQQKEIYGCDTDVRVATVARINLFMEMKGARAENLLTQDSLSDDTSLTGYDIILANMPFGLKGLKYADCSKRIKALKIPGTKSEPLFLQLMMVSLNMGGRCAVVVPDGMLVNSSTCHDGTRKYLMDHFELKRVIKMKGQFFMNTGIQPSILFFEKTGKPTEAVEFWDVVKNANGTIEEMMVVSVPRTKIDATSSFDMRRYLEVKAVANPAGFPMVKLGDLYEVPKIIKKFNSGDMDNTGDSAFFNGKWDCPDGTHSEHSYTSDKEYFVLIKDGGGDHSSSTVGMGKFFKVRGKCSITSHNLVLIQKKENDITHQYVYYYMSLNAKIFRDKARYSINLGSISMGDIMDFPISLPPLSIQQEIVATLDRIYSPGTTELADTLKMTDKAMDLVLAQSSGATLEPIVEAQRLIRKSAQMVADVKAQMVAVVKASMAGSGCAKYILSDLANDNPDNLTKADKFKRINYVDLSSVKEGNISTIQNILFEEKPSRAQRKIQNGDIIWGGVRPLSRSYAFIHTTVENMVGSSGFVVVRNKDITKVLSKYLYYVLTTDDCVNYLNSHSTGSSYPAFNASTIMAYELVIPSITIQAKTLERLDALQSQLTALESLQRQSEDNARFILESYLGDSSSVSSSVSASEPESEPESESEIRIIHDDAKDEQEAGVVYVDPEEQMEPVAVTNSGYAATASSTVKVVKCKKPVTSKTSKAS